MYFNLPFWIKADCVERAIKTAGGPKLAFQDKGTIFPFRKRSLGPAPPTPPLTTEKLYAMQIIYGNNTGPFQSSVPMNWTTPDSS